MKKKSKNPVFTALMMLVAILLVAVIPTEAEGAIYSDTLRLHILANSDSETDQALKLKIRDRVLEKYSARLKECDTIENAASLVADLTEEIKRDVDVWIIEEGFNYSSQVTIGTEWYDTRQYEDFSLPKGYYTSLRIIIGEGEGKNWWCVMFPPLCLDIATKEETPDDAVPGYTDAESTLIGGSGYTVKFKLLELFSEVINQKAKRG